LAVAALYIAGSVPLPGVAVFQEIVSSTPEVNSAFYTEYIGIQ
jgi:hypothetical protein